MTLRNPYFYWCYLKNLVILFIMSLCKSVKSLKNVRYFSPSGVSNFSCLFIQNSYYILHTKSHCMFFFFIYTITHEKHAYLHVSELSFITCFEHSSLPFIVSILPGLLPGSSWYCNKQVLCHPWYISFSGTWGITSLLDAL